MLFIHEMFLVYKLETFKNCKEAKHIIKKNFMAPFYGWGSTASRLAPLQGGSLLFTTKSPEILGTYFINLGRIWAVVLNTGPMDWESSTLTTRPLLHKRGYHKGAFIIAHIRGLYLMWYLIQIFKPPRLQKGWEDTANWLFFYLWNCFSLQI